MPTTPPPHPDIDIVRADLEAAAARRWGEARLPALAPALERLAEALATVAAFPLSPATEPYPTGPEAPRG